MIIPRLGEFIDALVALRRGHVLVKLDPDAPVCVIDGAIFYWSFEVLQSYRLILEYDNQKGFPGVRYFRLSQEGLAFADKAIREWLRQPWWSRMAARLAG